MELFPEVLVKFRGHAVESVRMCVVFTKMWCTRCTLKTSTFLTLILIIVLYIAYYIYLIVATYIERKEICEKLNNKYKKCDSVTSNPKRAIFQELLRKWIHLADRENINYVLSSGSLLGQYRNQDVIPWDTDIDVMLQDTMISKLQEITTPRNFTQGADKALHFVVQPDYYTPSRMRRWNCNGQVVKGQPDHCSFIGPIARLIKGFDFVDIFGLEIQANFAYEGYEKKYFRVDDIFPSKDCFFMKIKTKCPRNTKKILEIFFRSVHQPCVCVAGMWKIESWWKF